MKKNFLINGFMTIASLVVALALAELAVRSLAWVDPNGRVRFRGQTLKPYSINVPRVEEVIAKYLKEPAYSRYVFDPHLGWRLPANFVSENGLHRTNSAGIRADVDYSRQPAADTLRIAIFGDSQTFGDHVPLADTWGRQTEVLLVEGGIKSEVLNFGVGGYGQDQAYLRWQRLGRLYSPGLVILGFNFENTLRNLNIHRNLYRPGWFIPFFKPRFVLEKNQLRLVNTPAIPPEDTVRTLRDFEEAPISKYDYFYNNGDYSPSWWSGSRLLSYLISKFGPATVPDRYDPNGESARLAFAIMTAFRREVEATGARFLVVDLPHSSLGPDTPLPYADVLEYIEANFDLVRTREGFTDSDSDSYLAKDKKHYSGEAHRVIANRLADHIADLAR